MPESPHAFEPATLVQARERQMGSRQVNVDDLLRVVTISDSSQGPPDVAISPDGRYVLYRRREALVASNRYQIDLWLVATDGGAPRRMTSHDPVRYPPVVFGASWSPDSRRFAYVAPDKAARRIRLVDLDGSYEETCLEVGVVATGSGGANLQWSPDGRSIAFLRGAVEGNVAHHPLIAPATTLSDEGPLHGIDIDLPRGSTLASQAVQPRQVLALFDVETRQITVLGPESLNVTGFDWSPDGSKMVVAGSTSHTGSDAETKTDLYLLDPAGDLQQLVEQPGADEHPAWSPDGQWIAFTSHRGEHNWTMGGIPALVRASGGELRFPTAKFTEEIFDVGRVFWSADSSRLYFECPYRLGRHLFQVSLDGGAPRQVSPEGDVWFSAFSRSATNRVAFVRETTIDPQELHIGNLGDFSPARLTHLNSGYDELDRPQVQHLNWRSRDDRFDIHGLLLLPPGHREGELHPLLVEVVGGPTMVPAKFGSYAFPTLALAAGGYAVLMPNTRGRGGYGETFNRAIGLDGSEFAEPWRDLMAGVDLLVERHPVDPDRLGVMGHSYGAFLVAYGITQTNRFRAAAFHEGAVDALRISAFQWDSPDSIARCRENSGHGSPFDPDQRDAIIAESPIHQVHRIQTPVLIESGELSPAAMEAAIFANALNDRGVPFEFVVYPRTGHTTDEVALLRDDYQRDLSWFDYWLRDLPVPTPSSRPGMTPGDGRTHPLKDDRCKVDSDTFRPSPEEEDLRR